MLPQVYPIRNTTTKAKLATALFQVATIIKYTSTIAAEVEITMSATTEAVASVPSEALFF